MMKGSKAIIFGSFNEDGASSFQKAPKEEGLIAFKQNDLQFGSFVSESQQNDLQFGSFVSESQQNDLQFGSFESGFQCSWRNNEVSSKQATNGQVTKKDDLKELNTKLDASLGGICLIPNGRSTDEMSNEIKDQVSIGIQHKTTLLNSTTRKHPINENCILPTVNKSEPLHFSNSNTFATENDIGVTSANLESSSKAVSTANGLNKMSGRATCVQEFEDESSSNLMGKNTTQQLQSFNGANDDGVGDALDDLSSLSVNMPLSWAAKFGVKAGNGQVSHSQNGDQGRSKFRTTSMTAKAYHGNANSSSLVSLTSNASGGREIAMKRLQPRGLVNTGNLCFLNATLQALLSCSPFFQLLQTLRSRDIPEVDYPTLHAFVEFVVMFEEDEPVDTDLKKNAKAAGGIEVGQSFCPTMFDAILKTFSPDQPLSASGRPRQEDAQEFLNFVMDRLHNELLKLEGRDVNGVGGSNVSLLTDDDWETVGPKNRTAITRTQTFMESELSAIFGGQLRSVVKSRGNKASATIQPFLIFQLEIIPDAVHTVEDAFHLFASPESLEGYRISAGKAGVVSASKAVKLQKLPKVLILHLMRFSYGSTGSGKLHKPVRFSPEIVLGRELLVSPTTEGRRYELVATVTHHGRDPSKGHYTADTKHFDGQWLRFDDADVSVVGLNKVLHDQAYLLFYKQM